MSSVTLAFSENADPVTSRPGWISFFSYVPDFMCRLNNDFFSIKNGQIWLHNDNTNPQRNVFYGVPYDSSVTVVINDNPSIDKIFKTITTDSDEKWSAELTTNLTEGEIAADEFDTRESLQMAYIRQNEDADSMYGLSVNGIGTISSIDTLDITFSFIPTLIGVNDVLYQLGADNVTQEVIGTITFINREDRIITVNAITTTPVVGRFCFSKKNARIEGSSMVGLWMEVKLTNDSTVASELASISCETVPSTGLNR